MNDEFDDKLIAEARKLSTEISPERDLWPGIRQAIEQPQVHRRQPVFAQAAAVLVLIAASSGVTWYAVSKWHSVEDQQQVVSYQPELQVETASFGPRYNLGPEFHDARNLVTAEFASGLEQLSPEQRADIETSLAIVQSAIDAINVELEKNPENLYLQELLLKSYRDELALMRRVGGLTRNVMLRNDI